MVTKGTLNILIGGEAGLGLVTVGQLLAKVLVRSGFHIAVTQSYQSRIRGGHNTFAIRCGTGKVAAPCERVDLLVALDQLTADIHGEVLERKGLVVLDESLEPGDRPALQVPFASLTGKRFFNVAALGVAASLLGLKDETVAGVVRERFGDKGGKAAEENDRALAEAYRWASDTASAPFALEPRGAARRLMLNGNEAIALGALSAGAAFCAFYPMTPSTSIPLALAGLAGDAGMVVEQAEDEIAAVNMALGASFAGAPSLVATSGGGFALMAEGVSLAAMTETPLVIVVAQRPGPATGLPTRTEQGDLEFVLHAGHGEFPRAVFAPGSAEECFHLTRRAFEAAELSQGPVFILTDQYLADSYRDVEPFDMAGLEAVAPLTREPSPVPYERYNCSADGVSPRLFPGLSEHLVVADSDEHTGDGHLTEDLEVRKVMVRKRLSKAAVLQAQAVPPEVTGDDSPELLLVSWGSTKGAVEEAVEKLREGGAAAASLHFSQVWPLLPEQFLPALEEAGRVVCVEGNATGQMARLIRRETGFAVGELVLRFDGLPLTPEYILRGLEGEHG